MSVCVYSVCVVVCVGSGLATGWSPVLGVLPIMYRLWNWKSCQGPTKGCRTIERERDGNNKEMCWYRNAKYGSYDMRDRQTDRSSRTLYNSLMNNWEEGAYRELCTDEARRKIMWWKIGFWRLNSVGRNAEQGICPVCSKEEDCSHILRFGVTRLWTRDLGTSMQEIALGGILWCKNKKQLEITGLCITGVSDLIHRPDFNNYKKKNKPQCHWG
jgi:hypothetical protein